MKKKVTWTSAKTRPPDELVSVGVFGKKDHTEIPLLVLIKHSPRVHVGLFRHIVDVDKETGKKVRDAAYWHVFGMSSEAEVIAWRRCPQISEEYWEQTGYAGNPTSDKRTKAHQSCI